MNNRFTAPNQVFLSKKRWWTTCPPKTLDPARASAVLARQRDDDWGYLLLFLQCIADFTQQDNIFGRGASSRGHFFLFLFELVGALHDPEHEP